MALERDCALGRNDADYGRKGERVVVKGFCGVTVWGMRLGRREKMEVMGKEMKVVVVVEVTLVRD